MGQSKVFFKYLTSIQFIVNLFSATINGVKIYVYALLSGFGRGNSFLKYVSENLAQKFLHSSELESVLSQMKKIQPNGNMKNIDDRVFIRHLHFNILKMRLDNYAFKSSVCKCECRL